jgi:hypothetical protein
MATVYSTTDVPPHERIVHWNKIVSAGFAKLIVKAGDDFNGRLTVGTIGSLGVSTFECDPLSLHRGPRTKSRARMATTTTPACSSLADHLIFRATARPLPDPATSSFSTLVARSSGI